MSLNDDPTTRPQPDSIRLRYALLCRNTVPCKLLLMPGQMSGPRNGGGGSARRGLPDTIKCNIKPANITRRVAE